MHFRKRLTVVSIAVLGIVVSARAERLEADESLAVPKANFAAADADSDYALTPDEFVDFINANAEADFGKASRIKRFGAYERAFAKLDADEDGQVTWAEFEAESKRQ